MIARVLELVMVIIPSESVFSCKTCFTLDTLELLELFVHTVVMSIEISLADKLLLTTFNQTDMLLLSRGIVRL